MWGSYRSGSDVPCLRDYAAADAHEKTVKPIRGRAVSVKPLGDRKRVDIENIRRGTQNEIEVMVGYGGAYVTYYPSGDTRIRVRRGNCSSSTHDALNMLLPYFLTHKDLHTWVQLGDQWHTACTGDGLLIRDEAAVDPPKRYIHKVDRKAANAVRKRYKDFIDYCTGMGRLKTGENGMIALADEDRDGGGYDHHILPLITSGDPEQMYTAFLRLAFLNPIGTYDYIARVRRSSTTLKRILDSLNERILREHKDECFVAVDVTGTTQTDKRGW